MTLFPKTPRFPPEKGSQVPSPGRYNPLLHDPSQDQWRKGPLEIFKAPRNKEPDHGPDTFGLYNPDQVHDNLHASRPRPRAISTLATPSKHHKELLRLETKLSERESNITHLTETLHKSEKTMKEIKNALNKSEHENTNLQAEVERMRKQLQGVSGLQTKFIELESEHDKSKKRRDKEISHLKEELRLAEDRASRYLNEQRILDDDFKQFQKAMEDSDKSLESIVRKNNQVLSGYLQKLFDERLASKTTLQITAGSSRLNDVHTKKTLADRASQVTELVSLVNQANSREDLLYDLLDNLLETNDLQVQHSAELVIDLQSEKADLTNCLNDLKTEIQSRQQLSDQLIREKDVELDIARQETSLTQLELDDARLVCSSLEQSLMKSTESYMGLSGVCRSQVKELNKFQDDLAARDCEISRLTNAIQAQESQIVQLNNQMEDLKEKHRIDTEAWQLKESELQLNLKKSEKDLTEEKSRRSKLSAELLVARQAEAALNGEAEHARYLSAQIEETERENERLKRINDLIMRQSNMNAIEVERVEKLNTELASQQNPAQKVRVLDRMRKEIKEEKENTAKLENQLWAANSEIKSLKDELSAYQSISHPKPTSTIHNIMGTSRVTRPALTEVVQPFDFRPTIQPRDERRVALPVTKPIELYTIIQPSDDRREKQAEQNITTRKRVKTLPSNVDPEPVENSNACRLPIIQKRHQDLLRKRDELMKDTGKVLKHNGINTNHKNNIDNNNGEISLGAIKMQGKMTLDELR